MHTVPLMFVASMVSLLILRFSAISAPARKISPSFIGAISCHRREFHTSGECTIQALSYPRVGRLPLNCMQYSAAFH